MRKLAEEIRGLPHGRLKQIAQATGLTQKTLDKVVNHGTGSEKSAQLIAGAVGCPERWPELLNRTCLIVVAGRKRKPKIPAKIKKNPEVAAGVAVVSRLMPQMIPVPPSPPFDSTDPDLGDVG